MPAARPFSLLDPLGERVRVRVQLEAESSGGDTGPVQGGGILQTWNPAGGDGSRARGAQRWSKQIQLWFVWDEKGRKMRGRLGGVIEFESNSLVAFLLDQMLSLLIAYI